MCYLGLQILPNNTYDIGRKLLTNLPESVLGIAESSRYRNSKLEVSWLFRIACLRFLFLEFPCQCFKKILKERFSNLAARWASLQVWTLVMDIGIPFSVLGFYCLNGYKHNFSNCCNESRLYYLGSRQRNLSKHEIYICMKRGMNLGNFLAEI